MTSDDRGKAELERAAKAYCNWGRWGDSDQIGTLNFIRADDRKRAADLITRGDVFSLSLDYGDTGPQTGNLRRFNPMRFMLRDGDDTYSRSLLGLPEGIGGADDVVLLATHGSTHWDALAHVHYDYKMWNGYDCREVSSFGGAERNDISSYRDRIVGRGVLLDLPRYLGIDWCPTGRAITSHELAECAASQRIDVGRGDIVLLRFGQIAMCRASGSWGDYVAGDAPGLAFETLGWLHEVQVAGVASDTWGVEVRPNEFTYANQPWHRIAIPQMGLLVGEMFDLERLSVDCARDRRYDFFFCANPLPFVGSVGGPVNPIAIK